MCNVLSSGALQLLEGRGSLKVTTLTPPGEHTGGESPNDVGDLAGVRTRHGQQWPLSRVPGDIGLVSQVLEAG